MYDGGESYLHLKNLDDLQPDETEVKGIVPSPRYNLRARAAEEFLGVPLTPPKRVTHFPRLEEGNVPINTSWYGMFFGNFPRFGRVMDREKIYLRCRQTNQKSRLCFEKESPPEYRELLDDWNVDVPSWKYPRNLKVPRVSSPGFGDDSKMMVM
ncbi:hypothetical protein TNCV_1032721 [Trichonephila clavipes]|nr:hypothetical protein TNCV_1032721 [Trichonephila clavipes]